MTGRCIHCGSRVAAPIEVCESCLDLLSDLGEEDEPQPQPAPIAPHRPGRFEPTQADIQAYCELSERGSFRPLGEIMPKARPSHARNKWGRAIEAEKRSRRDPDVPKQ
jgi:hypothetical protein